MGGSAEAGPGGSGAAADLIAAAAANVGRREAPLTRGCHRHGGQLTASHSPACTFQGSAPFAPYFTVGSTFMPLISWYCEIAKPSVMPATKSDALSTRS